jgi:hypothetical protein
VNYAQFLADLGLHYHTVCSHLSALSNCLPSVGGLSVGSLPRVSRWRKGFRALRPPRRIIVPPWDLAVVLAALREPPYEPLGSADLKNITVKTAFLIAITSVRRVSELQALSAAPPYCTVNPRSAILRVNTAFLPKTTSAAALTDISTEIQLERFPRKVSSAIDRQLRLNCPVRALVHYLAATESCRSSTQLFVAFGEGHKGKAVGKQTIASWISMAIRQAYIKMARPDPVKSNAHTARGIAATWGEFSRAGLPVICGAATWSSALTFARYYRLDFARMSIGHSILAAAQQSELPSTT